MRKITIKYDKLGINSCGCGVAFSDWLFYYHYDPTCTECVNLVIRILGVIVRVWK